MTTPTDPLVPLLTPTITPLPIDSIDVVGRTRKDLGDVAALAESIQRVGLLHPVVVTPDYKLVVGRRRLEAFRRLGRSSIPAVVTNDLNELATLLLAERDENVCREPFRPTEALNMAAKIGKVMAPVVEQAAQAGRQKGGKTAGKGRPLDSSRKTFPRAVQDESRRLDSIEAQSVGLSRPTLRKIAAVVRSGDRKLIHELDATGKVDTVHRKLKEQIREAHRDENRAIVAQAEAPEQAIAHGARFATITIDPPWDYADSGDIDVYGRAKPTYATMPLTELAKLPVAELADTDCHLYMWATNRILPKAFSLLDAWGFRYVTCLTWCKPSIGMGNYYRGSTEQILFAVKGSQLLKRKDVGTWFAADRGPNGHSSKPVKFYELVESCSPGPYLEMFARSRRKDWTAWGAEA